MLAAYPQDHPQRRAIVAYRSHRWQMPPPGTWERRSTNQRHQHGDLSGRSRFEPLPPPDMPWTLDRLAPPLGNPPRLFLSESEQSDNQDENPSRPTPEVEYDEDGNILRSPLWSGDQSSWHGISESSDSSNSPDPRFAFPSHRLDRSRTVLQSSPLPDPELPRQSARFRAVRLPSAPLGGQPGFDPEPGPYFPPRHHVDPLSPTLAARIRGMPQDASPPLSDRAHPSIERTTPTRNPAPSSSSSRNSDLSLESSFRSQPASSSGRPPVDDRDLTPLPPAWFSPLGVPVVEERRVASRESQVSSREPYEAWRKPPPPHPASSFDYLTGSPLLSFRRTRGILGSLDAMRETHARMSQATALPTSVNTAAHTQALADIDMLRLRITDELVPSRVQGSDLSRARYDRLLPDEVPYVEGSNGERLNQEARGEIDSTMDAFRRTWDHRHR
jgi:hypothetical protein